MRTQKKQKMRRPLAFLLSLAMSVGIFSGIPAKTAKAYDAANFPSDYTELGYFIGTPQIVHQKLGLNNIEARIVTKGSEKYLHFETDWEYAKDCWGVYYTEDPTKRVDDFGTPGNLPADRPPMTNENPKPGDGLQGSFDYSHNTAWHNGDGYTISFCGYSDPIQVKFKINGTGTEYTASLGKITTPINYKAGYDLYYGKTNHNRFSADFKLDPNKYKNVQGLQITSIIGEKTNMYVYPDASYFNLLENATIINKISDGSNTVHTIQFSTNAPWTNTYNFDIAYFVPSDTELHKTSINNLYLSKGKYSATANITLPADAYGLAVIGITSSSTPSECFTSKYNDTLYYTIADAAFSFKASQPNFEHTSSYVHLFGDMTYNISTLGEYEFKFAYIENMKHPETKYITKKYNLQSKSGTITLKPNTDFAYPEFPGGTGTIILSSIKSPDGVTKTMKQLLFTNPDNPVPDKFNASVNVDNLVLSGPYYAFDLSVNYEVPKSGTYTIVFETEMPDGSKSTSNNNFTTNGNYGTYRFGRSIDTNNNAQPVMFSKDAVSITLVCIKDKDGNVVQELNDVLYPTTSTVKPKTGWYENEDGSWVYYENENLTKGWFIQGNKKYYFSTAGIMVTGWNKIDDNWYYFTETTAGLGVMKTGWVKDNNKWYYTNSEGHMLTGWQQIDGDWYYLSNSGAMVTGWNKISGKWYYFKSGVMVTGLQNISGKLYYLGSNGAMKTGWQQINSNWYYFTPSDGWALNGLRTIKDSTYYFNDYVMATGWQQIDGKYYYFGTSSGILKTGWFKDGKYWYYLDPTNNGAMVTDWKKINGNWYYFYPNANMLGKMAVDTYIGNDYVDPNGVYIPGL